MTRKTQHHKHAAKALQKASKHLMSAHKAHGAALEALNKINALGDELKKHEKEDKKVHTKLKKATKAK